MKKTVASIFSLVLLLGVIHSAKSSGPGAGSIKPPSESSLDFDLNEILNNSNLSSKQKAEKLTSVGELFMGLGNFMFAHEIFVKSLSLDPVNSKTQLLHQLTRPSMALRGLLQKVRSLASGSLAGRAILQRVQRHIPPGPLKDFLNEGTQEFSKESEVQAWADGYFAVLEEVRKYLKSNKNHEMEISYLKNADVGTSPWEALSSCQGFMVKPNHYQIKDCPSYEILRFKLNSADVEVFQQSIAGSQVYVLATNNYDLSGSLDVLEKLEPLSASAKTVWSHLVKDENFAKLRSGPGFKALYELGFDGVAALRWVRQFQDKLCPGGEGSKSNRPGYVFDSGLCLPAKTKEQKILNQIVGAVELALLGGEVTMNLGRGGKVAIQSRPSVFINSPLVNLKDLKPQFGSCGELNSFADNSLGGLFPDADFNRVIRSENHCKAQVK